jgi:hypothetical protein
MSPPPQQAERPEHDRLLRQLAECAWNDVERHFSEIIEFCRNLRSGSYPTRTPLDALCALEEQALLQRASFREMVQTARDLRSADRLLRDVQGMKKRNAAFLLNWSHLLREIRNSRYAIVPPFTLPYFDHQARRIARAFESECLECVRKTMVRETIDTMAGWPTEARRRLEQAAEEIESVETLPIFSGIEPRSREDFVLFEFDHGTLLQRSDGTVLWLLFFHFPVVDRHSVLVLPLFFHEFAHFLFSIDPTFRERVGDLARRLTADASETGVKWCEEFLADKLAVRIVGPAFLVSLLELASRGVGKQATDRHPSLGLRFDVVMRELKHLNYDQEQADIEALEQYSGLARPSPTSRVASELQSIERSFRDKLLTDGSQELDQIVVEFVEQLEDRGVFVPFSNRTFDMAQNMVTDSILRLIPPESPDAFEHPGDQREAIAILNVPSLMYRLPHDDSTALEALVATLGESASPYDADEVVTKLVRKALETASIGLEIESLAAEQRRGEKEFA